MPDMLFILLLALVVLGPSKLPEFARRLGHYRAKLKQMQREFAGLIEEAEVHLPTTSTPSDIHHNRS